MLGVMDDGTDRMMTMYPGVAPRELMKELRTDTAM